MARGYRGASFPQLAWSPDTAPRRHHRVGGGWAAGQRFSRPRFALAPIARARLKCRANAALSLWTFHDALHWIELSERRHCCGAALVMAAGWVSLLAIAQCTVGNGRPVVAPAAPPSPLLCRLPLAIGCCRQLLLVDHRDVPPAVAPAISRPSLMMTRGFPATTWCPPFPRSSQLVKPWLGGVKWTAYGYRQTAAVPSSIAQAPALSSDDRAATVAQLHGIF
jgi:hypothetical protein